MSTYKPGQWNAICDRCGFKFKSSELKEDWQGLMVCKDDFETRHPQTLLRIPTEKAFPEWSRPRPTDEFIQVCYAWTQGAYADLGTADCMKADNTALTYSFLISLRDNNG